MTNNADDLKRLTIHQIMKTVSDRIFVRPKLVGHGLVDDCHFSGVFLAIMLVKFATSHQTDAHRLEVVRSNRTKVRDLAIIFVGVAAAIDNDGAALPAKTEGGELLLIRPDESRVGAGVT